MLPLPAKDVLVGEPDHAVAVHGDVGRADQAAGRVDADGADFPGPEVVEADAPGGDEPEPVLRVFRQAHGETVQQGAGRILELLEMQTVVHAYALARA